MKFCRRCKEAKPLDEFVSHYGTRDGKSERCKQCDKVNQEEVRKRYWDAPAIQPEIKYCCRCKQNKPSCEFHRCRGKRDWLSVLCRRCPQESGKRYRYGITENQQLEILQSQGNCCAICGTALDGSLIEANPLSPNIDHCHTTGNVRGILCRSCNLALGIAEQGDWLTKAAEYLERQKCELGTGLKASRCPLAEQR